MPGFAIGYYENEINPEIYEPDKERRLGIRDQLEAGEITQEQAELYMETLVKPLEPHEKRLREDRAYREAWRTEADIENEKNEIEDRQVRLNYEKSRRDMEQLSREISAGINPDDQ
jgi:hypothetical protein